MVFSSSNFPEFILPPHLCAQHCRETHTHRHMHHLDVSEKKVSPALDDDNKQNRSEEAPGRRFLGFYYAAPVRTTNLVREMREIWCFARRTL